MQWEIIFEYTNDKCHMLHFSIQEKDIPQHTHNLASVICVHRSELVDHYHYNIGIHLKTLLNLLMPIY